MAVNLDTRWAQSGWLDLDIEALALDPAAGYVVHDLISGERFAWHGRRHFVRLEPGMGHVLRLERPAA
jgi:starch synthase (maltosyl-transferring)